MGGFGVPVFLTPGCPGIVPDGVVWAVGLWAHVVNRDVRISVSFRHGRCDVGRALTRSSRRGWSRLRPEQGDETQGLGFCHPGPRALINWVHPASSPEQPTRVSFSLSSPPGTGGGHRKKTMASSNPTITAAEGPSGTSPGPSVATAAAGASPEPTVEPVAEHGEEEEEAAHAPLQIDVRSGQKKQKPLKLILPSMTSPTTTRTPTRRTARSPGPAAPAR
jgi:hypothetical protein